MATLYEDPLLKRIIELMNENGPSVLRGHWGIGDPIAVPQSQLPAAFIQYDTVPIADSSNATIEFQNNIVITVAINQKKGNSTFADDIASHNEIVSLVMARDQYFNVMDSSIVGTLRKYQDLRTGQLWVDVGSLTSVEYGVGREARGPGIMTAEAVIRFQINSEQIKPEFY